MDAVKLERLLIAEVSAVDHPALGPQGLAKDWNPADRSLEGWMVAKAIDAADVAPSVTRWQQLLEELSGLYEDTGWFRNLRSLVARLSEDGLVSLPAAEMEEVRRAAFASFLPDLHATQKAEYCRGVLGEFLRSEDPRVRKAARDTVVSETLTDSELDKLPAGPPRGSPSPARPAETFFRPADTRPTVPGMKFFGR